ncbi:MAG: LD-carboxypeptidase [Gemmatimonadota bacterium]|nr:LD-carboxypeptidase [Gemmatimonadota bacterium]
MPITGYTRVRTTGAGARIALVAPSGPLVGESDVNTAISTASALGWECSLGEHVLDRYSYFAARDAQRAADFNAALRDDSVDAIWCLRGGYGVMRILDHLDYDAMRRHPKPVIGYSDISALHAAVGRACEIVTYHAPNARTRLTPFSRDSFERAIVSMEDSCGRVGSARVIRGGTARGRLAGGNLSLISSLAGTPYLPDLDGAILVLEDTNEGLYRIDRMLTQLSLAGELSRLQALVFGYCTDCDADESPGDSRMNRTLDDVLLEFADALDIPCVAGIPMGHVDDQWTIPLGAIASLDADALTLTVEV